MDAVTDAAERLEFLQDQVDSLTALREKFETPTSGNSEDTQPPQGSAGTPTAPPLDSSEDPGHQLLLKKFGPLDVLGLIKCARARSGDTDRR
jgi:hypothetical protein